MAGMVTVRTLMMRAVDTDTASTITARTHMAVMIMATAWSGRT